MTSVIPGLTPTVIPGLTPTVIPGLTGNLPNCHVAFIGLHFE